MLGWSAESPLLSRHSAHRLSWGRDVHSSGSTAGTGLGLTAQGKGRTVVAGLPLEPASSTDSCQDSTAGLEPLYSCQMPTPMPAVPRTPARSGHPPPEGCSRSYTANDRCGQSLWSQAGTGLVLGAVYLSICHSHHTVPLLRPVPSFCALEQCLLLLSALKQVMLLIQQSHPCPYAVFYKLICVNPKKHMILEKWWGVLISLAETKQKKVLNNL